MTFMKYLKSYVGKEDSEGQLENYEVALKSEK